MNTLPVIHVKFFSETLGMEVGETYIKTLVDAVRANAGKPNELAELRNMLAEGMAIADNLIYNCKKA